MESIEEIYCAYHHCDGEKFSRRVFWSCLHRHAWPMALLLGGFGSRYFAADRAMIGVLGKATHLHQVREEARYFCTSPNSHGWWRGILKIRLSTRRMVNLAGAQLFRVELARARLGGPTQVGPLPDSAAMVPFVTAQPANAPVIDSPAGLPV